MPCGAKTKKISAKGKCYILFLSQSLLKFLGKATGQEERKESLRKTKGGENTENNDNYSDNPDSSISSSHLCCSITIGNNENIQRIFKGRFVLGCSW